MMAGMYHIENDTVVGTVGGTLLAIVPQLDTADVVRTLVLAAVGAVASFFVTQFCRWLWRRWNK